MVHHLVFWSFCEELSPEKRKEAAETIKDTLVNLKKEVVGVISLEVKSNQLESSNKDIALISSFTSMEALNAYQIHPAHVEAGKFVKSVTTGRICFDYEA